MRKFLSKSTLRTRISLGVIFVLLPISLLRLIYVAIGATPVASAIWHMDEATGSTVGDASNNSNSGTITNALWKTKELCMMDNCLFFDGTGDFVSRADDADFDFIAANSFTISLWFRHAPKTSGTDVLVAKHNATAGGYKMYMESDGDITCGIDDDSSFGPEDFVTSTAATYDDNVWHHVACVKNGTTSLTLYIDGQSVGTPDTSFTATGTLENADTFYVGIDGNGSSNPFTGFIDEFRLFREELSASEVKADFTLGASAQSANQPKDSLSDGLVGYWKLDEASGNAADSSGNETTLTNVSTTVYTGAKYGNGIEPDGAADYMHAADSAILSQTGSITLAAWIEPDDISGTENIIAKWDGTNESYRLTKEDANVRMYIDSDSNYQATTGNPLAADTKAHVVGVYDTVAQTVRIFVNGKLATSSTTGTIPSSIGDDAGQFQLAAEDHNNTPKNFFNGHIDEARMYNRALSDFEVNALYSWAAGPVAYWKFDENTGQLPADSSGYSNTAQLGASTAVETVDPQWTSAKVSSGLRFNGSTSSRYAIVADDDDLEVLDGASLTITAWVRKVGNAGSNNPSYIVDKQNGSTNAGYALLMNSTSDCSVAGTDGSLVCFRIHDGTDTYTMITSTSVYNDLLWHQV